MSKVSGAGKPDWLFKNATSCEWQWLGYFPDVPRWANFTNIGGLLSWSCTANVANSWTLVALKAPKRN
eukprot:14495341-Alexandrium_andersonii.AAC.1